MCVVFKSRGCFIGIFYGFVCVVIMTLKMFQYGSPGLSHILLVAYIYVTSDCINHIAAFACEVVFAHISGTH